MRSVVLYTLLSLDGVAESPDDFILDWDDQLDANLAEVIAEQDAVLLGRGMYEEWAAYWPTSDIEPFATFINGVQKFVIGSREPDGDWAPRTVVTDDLTAFVTTLKQTEGASIGVHGSISLARSMLAADLIDELRLVIAPVTRGSGHRLFGADDLRHWTLLTGEVSPSGALVVHYRRNRD